MVLLRQGTALTQINISRNRFIASANASRRKYRVITMMPKHQELSKTLTRLENLPKPMQKLSFRRVTPILITAAR